MSTKTLKASVVIGGSVSAAFRSAMSTTQNSLKGIGEAIANVERRQRLMGRGIETFGRMGRNVDHLRTQYADLTREADRLRVAQTRLQSVQSRVEANAARRAELGGQFRSAATTFGVVAAATLAPVRTAAEFETRMLGVAKQLDGARDAAGNLTPVYFGMVRDVQRLGREIPLATGELADMVAAGLRMGVAKDEVIDFTRTAAMMADAFDMPAGQLADDMGKIAGLFHIPIPKIGELADAINYLDDNSQAKGSEIIDVMRRIGGMAQALKMPAKEAAALGSTFVHLGSSAEVAGTASNAVLRILGAATAQSKRVRDGLATLGLSAQGVQSSMARDASGTILSVLDKLNSLGTEQRMVTATQLFGAEYGDDVAKLATGVDEYRRQLQLANGEAARGSMSREFEARLKTVGAQWQITKNRIGEVAVSIGEALVPAIKSMMKSVAPAIDGFASWARENPGVVKGIIGSTVALAGLRVVAVGVAYAWTAVKTPVLSVMRFIAKWRAEGAIKAIGRFGPAALRVGGVLRTMGAAIAAIGGGPITVVVAALTAGALVVRKYWQPIRAWLAGAFEGIRSAAGPALAELGAALAPLRPAWDAVSSAIGQAWDWIVRLLEAVNMTSEQLAAAGESGRSFGQVIGSVIGNAVRGAAWLVKGFIAVGEAIGTAAGFLVVNFTKAWDNVKSIIGSAVDWIMRRVGPVFTVAARVGGLVSSAAQAVGFTSTGDERAPQAPRPRIAMPAPARGRPANLPTPAPGGRSAGGSVTDASTHHYNIVQQPGESPEALARRIEDERRRRSGVEQRGSLVDVAM